MKILYLGNLKAGSTAVHAKDALRRLGHSVDLFDPWLSFEWFRRNRLGDFCAVRTGYRFHEPIVYHYLAKYLKLKQKIKYDLIWVNGGELFGKKTLKLLNFSNCPIVLFNNDDITGKRDRGKFYLLKQSLAKYNLIVTRREPTRQELISIGCKNVLSTLMSYDEIIHAPPNGSQMTVPLFESDISFIGTYIRNENRDTILSRLTDAGFKVKIFGPRWNLCRYKKLVKHFWVKDYLVDREYVHAITGAKICLGLLSSGNRDQHTRRSMEIPYAGGLLLAERTLEHQFLYEDRKEAVFFSDSDELVERARWLLRDSIGRESIRRAGMKRVRELRCGNEDICGAILNKLIESGLVRSEKYFSK